MKIEEGKLYYDTKTEQLFIAPNYGGTAREGITNKIAVHCPTKEDCIFVNKTLGVDVVTTQEDVLIFIDTHSWDDYRRIDNYKLTYNIITIDEFKELYPEEVDKFAELKEAHKNGAVIQCRAGVDREWEDCRPVWSNRYEYRIKPISKEEQKESYDDPYNWGSIIIDSDNYKTNAMEAEYQNRGAILRTHIPLPNADEFNPNSEEELKEDEEILRRAREGISDFYNITESIADLLVYKNAKYGNAVLEPLQIFSGKCKAGTRLDDKLGRIKNSSELRKNDVADLIGYLILTCKENNWTDFSEFKD